MVDLGNLWVSYYTLHHDTLLAIIMGAIGKSLQVGDDEC